MIGIGFRKDFAEDFLTTQILKPDFIELAPENWMGIGGYWKKVLHQASEKYPVYTHGLSLSIGGPDPLNLSFLKEVKTFLDTYHIPFFSEHLSFSSCDNAHLYDLLPIPFRWEAVTHVASRIRQVQEILERKIAMEIVSYYTPVAAEMSELEFINFIVEESDCSLLLDVNNIYVNAFNHGYDAKKFINGLPLDKITYIHMAGHEQVSPDLIIDTHGEAIIPDVYDLLSYAWKKLPQPVPVLLERDFNIPQLSELQLEINQLRDVCHSKNQTYAFHT